MEETNTENTQQDLYDSFKDYLDMGNFYQAEKVILSTNSLEMFDLAKKMSGELEEIKAQI